jgi:hypothetical protein
MGYGGEVLERQLESRLLSAMGSAEAVMLR